MQLLYALAKLRTPFLDTVLGALTNCGGEIVFMAVAIIVFWCVSKSCGYYMLTVGFVGTIVNQFLKLVFRIPRPWVKDPDFRIVESARGPRPPLLVPERAHAECLCLLRLPRPAGRGGHGCAWSAPS